jgi:hypothetical protein
MGYRSRVRGEITYSPALDPAVVAGNETIAKYTDTTQDWDIFLDTGWNSITVPCEDEFKAYWLVSNLTELVTAMLAENPKLTFSGYLEIQGEGDGVGDIDLWRLAVRDNEVKEIFPELVWPED